MDEIEHDPTATNVTTPLEALTVQIDVVLLENEIDPPPIDGDADIVGGESLNWYGPLSPVRASVRVNGEITKEIGVAFAEAKEPPEEIDAEIVHVPADTNETNPLEELMVQTDEVELEYDLVPLPTPSDTVDVMVGFVTTLNAYGLPAYDDEFIVNVREVNALALTEKVRDEEVAAA